MCVEFVLCVCVCVCYRLAGLKGLVPSNKKTLLFIHPHFGPNLYDFIYSLENFGELCRSLVSVRSQSTGADASELYMEIVTLFIHSRVPKLYHSIVF